MKNEQQQSNMRKKIKRIKIHWFLLLFWRRNQKPVFSFTPLPLIWMALCLFWVQWCVRYFSEFRSFFVRSCHRKSITKWFSGAAMFKFADSKAVNCVVHDRCFWNGAIRIKPPQLQKTVTVKRISTSLKPLLLPFIAVCYHTSGPTKQMTTNSSLLMPIRKPPFHRQNRTNSSAFSQVVQRQTATIKSQAFSQLFLQHVPIHNRASLCVLRPYFMGLLIVNTIDFFVSQSTGVEQYECLWTAENSLYNATYPLPLTTQCDGNCHI